MTTRLPTGMIKFESAGRIPFGESKSADYARLPCHIYARCSPPRVYRLASIATMPSNLVLDVLY